MFFFILGAHVTHKSNTRSRHKQEAADGGESPVKTRKYLFE